MKTAAVATPLAFVQAVVVTVVLSANVPLAALAVPEVTVNDGAVNVTSALLTGTGGVLPSITVTASGIAKGVPAVALCGVVPADGVIVAGVMVFDRVKVAVDESPSTVSTVEAITEYCPPGVPLATEFGRGVGRTPADRLVRAVNHADRRGDEQR